jgi:type I restriction-modification system DNA methylase subunit
LYNNRSLFSDYYLRELVRDDPHWRDVLAGVPAFRQKIADIYKRGMPGIEQADEGEVEERIIRPVLRALGHVYEIRPDVRSAEGTKTPDYGFFATTEDRTAADNAGIEDYWKHALAVGDAKAWDRSLDRRLKGPGDPFTNHNPSYQIDFYLRATDLKWGILTNGRLWRLYYRDLSYRLDVYYEVNLLELLERTDEEFNYFAAFFSQRAFIPDEQGVRFLDRAYKGSLDYATGLSKELKDNVYEALRLLTEGFLRFPGNGLPPEELDRIRENAFVVIYRLLFILYAEDRGFLPLENRDYGDTYSLRALARDIAQKLDGRVGLSSAASGYWSRLQDLFRMIDAGDAALGIPPYNGGLFDESRHPELGQWRVDDSHLARAVDMLVRATAAERTGRGFVSYRELSIRELGSIYEGLLEHRPRIAEEPMVVVRDDKRERVIPEREAKGKKVLENYRPGEVYLTLHRGERKATGSYYTPDYIVKYIVANTVEPLIEEQKESSADPVEAILSLNVLDPAMGSGHFLVEATDFLARALVEALSGEAGELEEDDIRWARREVVERCIYGVDLNPLAVELAKLSLWLHTVSRDRPLNFLDHHLRCGNSLIGAWLEDLGQLPTPAARGTKRKAKAPTAITTLEGHRLQEAIAAAVRTFHAIAEAPTHTVEDVHTKENAYQTARHALSRIIDIADAWTSAYFGNEVDPDDYARLLLEAYAGDGDWPTAGEIGWLDMARDMGREERRFFHWELEFPEVFFDPNGQRVEKPGFEAVVGNPPWLGIRTGELEPELVNWLRLRFKCATGQFDLAAIFLDFGCLLASERGVVGMVVPKRLGTNESYESLREVVAVRRRLLAAIDLGVTFQGVNNDALVLISGPSALRTSTTILGKRLQDEQIAASPVSQSLVRALPFRIIPVNSTPSEVALTVKISEGPVTPLGAAADIARGAECGMNHSAISRTATPRAVPILDHLDVRRYYLEHSGWYIDPSKISTNVLKPMSLYATVPKLLVRFLSPTLVVAKDDVGFVSTNLLYHVKCRDNPDFLCAVLSSRLMDSWYRTAFQNEEVKFPHVQKSHLERLPIRRIDSRTPQKERERLVAEAKRLHAQGLSGGDFKPFLAFVETCLPTRFDGSPDLEQEKADVVRDLLAHLAQQMTEAKTQKQEEAKGFLAWLEGYVGVGVDDLQNKTKVREYYELESGWDEFAAALDQNRGAIQRVKGIDVTRREPREAIRQEYKGSMARLRPLLRKIELTDRLIDLIVYRLYGLTDEEIAIVEGRTDGTS